jgi:transglutaminase-like putative cysteine protease
MLYAATHITRHIYPSPATQSLNELRLTPRSLPTQQVLASNIRIEPIVPVTCSYDYFGNRVCTVELFKPHDHFLIEATSTVEVQPRTSEPLTSPAWECARDHIAAHPDADTLEALEFVFDSPFVPCGPDFAEFARLTFTPGRPLVEALIELNSRIHSEFRYKPQSTSIDMPLLRILRTRQGVCQDFAHIMIASLRSVRLAARYVSGYLRSSANHQGAEASHAWVSVFVPGRGWLSFDPTNDVMPSEGHITVAWGRDYGDAMPVKGITVGGGDQLIEVEVRVQAIEAP